MLYILTEDELNTPAKVKAELQAPTLAILRAMEQNHQNVQAKPETKSPRLGALIDVRV